MMELVSESTMEQMKIRREEIMNKGLDDRDKGCLGYIHSLLFFPVG